MGFLIISYRPKETRSLCLSGNTGTLLSILSNEAKTVVKFSEFYWIVYGKKEDPLALYSFDFIYSRSYLWSSRWSVVLTQLNCGYASSFAIVRNVSTHPISFDVTTKGVLVASFHFIEAKTWKRIEKWREDDIPRSLRLRNHTSELRLCFLSICARLLELFACIAACINPPQDAFNDTDASRISAQETRSKFRCYLKSFSYSLVTITMCNQLEPIFKDN